MRDILQSRYLRSNVAHKQLARTSLRRETLILPFGWRGPGAHCVAMEMSQWTHHEIVISATTVQSFSSIKTTSEIYNSILCNFT